MTALLVLAGCARGAGEVAGVGGASTTTSSTAATTAEPEATTPPELPAGEAAPTEAPADDPGEDDPIVGPATGTPRARAARGAPAPAAPSASVNRIEIPAIGLSHPTFEGIDLATINRGPSHWPGTPQPGERGNTVFPGHRTTYTRPFWDIDKLVADAGDEVIFTTARGRFTYRVTDTFVVGSSDTWIVDPTEQATFTIFACHPKGSARQRYVVKGDLVSAPAPAPPPPPGEPSRPEPPPPTTTTTAPPELLPGLGV